MVRTQIRGGALLTTMLFAVLVAGCSRPSAGVPTPSSSPVYWEPNEATSPASGGENAAPSASAPSGAPAEALPPAAREAPLIADHRAAAAFDAIPSCWRDRAKGVVVAYEHTSHGSQIVSGLRYLAHELGSAYQVGGPSGLALRDRSMHRYGSNANDLGYDGWSAATEAYLRANPLTKVVMWSWCGQVGQHVDDLPSYLFQPARQIMASGDVRFVYMTGHLDGKGPTGNTWRANDVIRNHVRATNGILYDFADIEAHDPAGQQYPNGGDSCEWCTTWCQSHPSQCTNLPRCAHSHGFNCVQKGKAYWWLVARIAGWNGDANHGC